MRRVRRLSVVLVLVVAVGAAVALTASARGKGFHDDFTTLDASRWLLSSRPFGYGSIDPANVTAADGQLGIRLPANRLDGGETARGASTSTGSTARA